MARVRDPADVFAEVSQTGERICNSVMARSPLEHIRMELILSGMHSELDEESVDKVCVGQQELKE